MSEDRTLTPEREQEMRRIKAMLPFRIVYGTIDDAGNWFTAAVFDMRQPNAARRKGWPVWVLKPDKG